MSRHLIPIFLSAVCKTFRFVMLMVFALLCSNAIAQQSSKIEPIDSVEPSRDAASTDSPRSVLSGVTGAVDNAHGAVSDNFSRFVVQIDDFFGSREQLDEANKSWARIRIDTVKPGGSDVKLRAGVKLKVVLPRSQQRFRLLFSTEDDDVSASNSDAAQREQLAGQDNNDVSLALRFMRIARDSVQVNYDLGARFRDDKAQLFGRINASYNQPWKWGFNNNITNNLIYYSASGFENRLRFDLQRNFFDKKSVFFRNSLALNWRKGLKGTGFGETMGFYADLGKRKAIALEAIAGYSTSLNNGETDRYKGAEVRIRFRHSIWRKWFYYEIWPSVSWSASNDYKQAYGGLLRLEVVLGSI